jgi:hypothetical protein
LPDATRYADLFFRRKTAVIIRSVHIIAEFGHCCAVGRRGTVMAADSWLLRRADKRVSIEVTRACLAALGNQYSSIKEQILEFDSNDYGYSVAPSQRPEQAPSFHLLGVGRCWRPLWCGIADPKAFDHGRNFRLGFGLIVSEEHSSGGKEGSGRYQQQA